MKVVVVDCRFEYEYRAGHIRGALSAPTTRAIDHLFYGAAPVTFLSRRRAASLPLSHPKVMLVFHCEFSSHRAPTLAKYLRGLDRSINQDPNLIYPNVFILHGGYEAFFRTIGRSVRDGPSGDANESESSSDDGIFERPASVPPPSSSPTSRLAPLRTLSMSSRTARRRPKLSLLPQSAASDADAADGDSEVSEDDEDEDFAQPWDVNVLFDPAPPVYVKMDDRRFTAEKRRGLARIRRRSVLRRSVSSGDVAAFALRVTGSGTSSMSASAATSLDVELAAQERWLFEVLHRMRLELQRLRVGQCTPASNAMIAQLKEEIERLQRTQADHRAELNEASRCRNRDRFR